MSEYGSIRFNIKTTGINASTDAGTQTKDDGQGDANLKSCEIEYFTNTSLGVRLSVNDIITYGGNSFRTGLCCGFLYIRIPRFGRDYVMGVDCFTEVKKGNDAYFRFNFRDSNFRSTYYLENGP